MFLKVGNVNYFVITENKTPIEIFEEIFTRMQDQKISSREKRNIISSIKEQIRK